MAVMMADFMGAKRPPDGAPPQKPDPGKYTLTDFAPWLKGSAFDAKPQWSEEDEIRLAASRMLGQLDHRRRERDAGKI